MMVQSYKELKVRQNAMRLVTEIYRLTASFPKEEIDGLSSQRRRAAISIASNLAEDAARNSTKDHLRFVTMADSSVAELETQLTVAFNLQHTTRDVFNSFEGKMSEIARMLNSLERALKNKLKETTNHRPLP